MIILYLTYVFALLLFCRNAGLGSADWERHAILFAIAAPTVCFCATPVGAIALYVMLGVMVELMRNLAQAAQVRPVMAVV